jgi:hypothetical protein
VVEGVSLSPNGLGPYQVGTDGGRLQEALLLTAVQRPTGCPLLMVAKGLPQYRSPGLVFYQGKLQYASVTSSKTPTTGGAKVGMALADVKKKHPAGKQLTNSSGGVAWLVTAGQHAMIFRFKGGRVDHIEAGDSATVQFRFTDGEGC